LDVPSITIWPAAFLVYPPSFAATAAVNTSADSVTTTAVIAASPASQTVFTAADPTFSAVAAAGGPILSMYDAWQRVAQQGLQQLFLL
jgi:hypothetical protein